LQCIPKIRENPDLQEAQGRHEEIKLRARLEGIWLLMYLPRRMRKRLLTTLLMDSNDVEKPDEMVSKTNERCEETNSFVATFSTTSKTSTEPYEAKSDSKERELIEGD